MRGGRGTASCASSTAGCGAGTPHCARVTTRWSPTLPSVPSSACDPACAAVASDPLALGLEPAPLLAQLGGGPVAQPVQTLVADPRRHSRRGLPLSSRGARG